MSGKVKVEALLLDISIWIEEEKHKIIIDTSIIEAQRHERKFFDIQYRKQKMTIFLSSLFL